MMQESEGIIGGSPRNFEPPEETKLARARVWLAHRALARGPHRYVPGVPTVLLPVAQRYIARIQRRQ